MSYQRHSLKQNTKQPNINRFSYLLKDPEITQQSSYKQKQKNNTFSFFSCLTNNKCKQTNIKEFDQQFDSTEQIKINPIQMNHTHKFQMQELMRSKDQQLQTKKIQSFSFQTPRKQQSNKPIELSTHYQSKSFSIASQPILLEKQLTQQKRFIKKSPQHFESRYEQELNDKQKNSQLMSNSSFSDFSEIKNSINLLKTYEINNNAFSKNQNGIKTPNKQKIKIVSEVKIPDSKNKDQKCQKFIISKQQRVKTHEMTLKLSQSRQKQSNFFSMQVMTPTKSIKLKGKSKPKLLKRFNQSQKHDEN